MLLENQKTEIRNKIESIVERLNQDLLNLIELTKPISPENAIGRISRMDAINNKSVNEASLRNTKNRLERLKRSLKEIDSESFGLCRQCGTEIEFKKLLVMPDSFRCVTCVKSNRV